MKSLSLVFLLSIPFIGRAQDTLMRTHKFGEYVVKTGFCKQQSLIEILKNSQLVYRACGGDGFYGQIDTLHLNNDNRLDFIFSYRMEEYFSMGCLVSNNNSSYDNIDLGGEYMEPNIPDSISISKAAKLLDFKLTRNSIMINVYYAGSSNYGDGYFIIDGKIAEEAMSYKKLKRTIKREQNKRATSP